MHTKRSDETDGEYFVRELRIARALGFLRRICPPAGEEIKQLLYERHSNKRVASAVAIALKAEELLAQKWQRGRVRWLTRILWCAFSRTGRGPKMNGFSSGGPDFLPHPAPQMVRTNRTSFSWNCSINSRRFTFAFFMLPAEKALKWCSTAESASKVTLYCTADELIEAAGTHSLPRIQQTIGHLANFRIAGGKQQALLHSRYGKDEDQDHSNEPGFGRCSHGVAAVDDGLYVQAASNC